jgi:hypothetical protein
VSFPQNRSRAHSGPKADEGVSYPLHSPGMEWCCLLLAVPVVSFCGHSFSGAWNGLLVLRRRHCAYVSSLYLSVTIVAA